MTTSWGRIGTAGQSKTKDFGSTEAAQKEESRLLREKTREGYKAVGGAKTAKSATVTAAKAATTKTAKAAKAAKPAKAATTKTATAKAAKASKVPTGPLTAAEMWELGQAIAGKAARKISGRLDLEMGAGVYYDMPGREQYGPSLPSKAGKLLLGFRDTPKAALSIAAAPGNGANVLFTVYHRTGTSESSEGFTWGIRFVATPPVRWKLQKSIPVKDWRVRAAVWTPGASLTEELDYYFKKLKTGSILEGSCGRDKKEKEPIQWALGYDATGKAVCMLFAIPDRKLLAAIDGKQLAEPPAEELAALRRQPHRLALSAKHLNIIAGALQHGPKFRDRGDKWKALKVVTKDVRILFAGEAVAKVPSVKGALCLGNVLAPAQAMKLEVGDAQNRAIELQIRTGRCHVGKLELDGVTLSSEAPVRWQVMGEFSPGKPQPKNRDKSAVIGVWSPGRRLATEERPEAAPGAYTWFSRSDIRLTWIIGYGASETPAALLAGDARAAAYFDRGGAVLAYDEQAAAKQVAAAKADRERQLKEDAAEEAATNAAADGTAVVSRATAAELAAIASAIAAGPSKKANVGKRFSLHWDDTAIPTVAGKLRVGDPNGASFELAAGVDGPKQAFIMIDDQEGGAGWGRVILGVRLGAGKVVKWKPSMGLGVDSGHYGVWSPGYPTDDVDDGTHTANALAAKILQTSQGDCSFPSLLGLDAAKQPVAFLFGEAVRPDVFAAR